MNRQNEEKEITFEWEVRDNDIPYSKHIIGYIYYKI